MRCPKCGYISFDHLDTCLKCNKKISKASDALNGTIFNVAAPSFLKVNLQSEEDDNIIADADFDNDITMTAIDPDLDILLDEDGNTDDALDEFSAIANDDGEAFTITNDLEDDDDGIAIDFNQFEDAELDASASAPEINLDVPEELSDLSDLEQPTKEASPSDEMQLELDLDDFDTDLGELGGDDSPAVSVPPVPPAEEEISFNDFDLSLDDDDSPAAKSSNDDDDDLDIDLDLGGLSLEK